MKLSVVMPSYNEEEAIGPMIDEIKKHSKGIDTEIVVVDSSSDNTAKIAKEKGARVIWQEPSGHGKALRKAMIEASGDVIITTDCDMTYPMEYIPILWKLITEENYDIISCNRMNKMNEGMPIANRLANWGFAFLTRTLYKINTNDVTTGMFAIKRDVVHSIDWETNYAFPFEIIARSNLAGFKYKEIDIPYRIRIGEVTLNRWRSGKAYLKAIFKYRFNLKIPKEEL